MIKFFSSFAEVNKLRNLISMYFCNEIDGNYNTAYVQIGLTFSIWSVYKLLIPY